MAFIDIVGLSKSLEGKSILANVNLSIYEKEVFGIIGGSGSGKTTLFKTLCGFYSPDQGQVLVEGKEVSKVGKNLFGFCSQEGSFYPELTVIDNLKYFGRMFNLSSKMIEENARLILGLVGLSDKAKAKAKNLSGGQQKLLDIACALIHAPKIVIMDEPTAGLDPSLRRQIENLVLRINGILRATVIICSHYIDELEALCSRVGVLFKGSIILTGNPAELKDKYFPAEEIKIQTRPGNYAAIKDKLKTKAKVEAEIVGGMLLVRTFTPRFTIREVVDCLGDLDEELVHAEVTKPSLSEIFEAYLAKK